MIKYISYALFIIGFIIAVGANYACEAGSLGTKKTIIYSIIGLIVIFVAAISKKYTENRR